MCLRIFAFLLGGWITAQSLVLDPALAGEDKYHGFPFGKGQALVADTCTACHSSKLVLQNRMSRDNWNETITWMQEKQGLWELTVEERTTILDYLSTVLGTEETGSKQSTQKESSKARKRVRIYQYDYKPNPL